MVGNIPMSLLYNVKWVSLSQVIRVLCQVLAMVFFSRYLTPIEIGIMAMTVIVVNFVNVLRDMGSSAAIIQKDNVTDELICSVFYLNLLMGAGLFFLVYFCSGLIAAFFKEPLVSSTLSLVAIAFPINSVTSVHLALLERDSKFNKIAAVEIFSSLLSLSIAVLYAMNGGGVYSLVLQTLLYSVLSSLGFWFYSKWLPKFKFSLIDIKSIFSFSSNLIGFNIINYFSRNSDQIIIGRFFSADLLGQYSLAYRIMLFPVQNITFVLTRSLYPLLSRLQNDPKEAYKIYLKTLRAISFIIPPLMLGVCAVSDEFVLFVFGNKWVQIPGILVWLAPVAIMQSLVSTTGAVFMSHAKTNVLLRISIYNAFLQISAFLIGAFYSLKVLVILYCAANVLMFVPNMYLAFSVIGGRFVELFQTIWKPLFSAFVMYSVLRYFSEDFVSHNVLGLSLIMKIIMGILVYFFCVLVLEHKMLLKFLSRQKRLSN